MSLDDSNYLKTMFIDEAKKALLVSRGGESVPVSGWVRPSEWPAQPKGWKDEACAYLLIDCTGEFAYLHLKNFSGNAYMGTTAADGTFVADSDEPIALVNGRVRLKDEDFGNRDYCWIKIVPSNGNSLSILGFEYADSQGLYSQLNTWVEHLTANVAGAFSKWESINIVHVHAFNCSLTDLGNVAYTCQRLRKFEVENCTVNGSVYRAFSGCPVLEEVSFKGTTVTTSNMSNTIFAGCSSLREIDLSGFTYTGNGTVDILGGNLFNLKRINLDGFTVTGSVTNTAIIMSYARSLENIDLSIYANAPISKISMDRLSSIRELSFPSNNWALTIFSLRETQNLETLDVSNIDFTNVKNLSSGELWGLRKLMHCSAINANVSIDMKDSVLLTHESLMNIINGLPTVETAQTLTVGTVNTAKLTENEIAIATAKGWTVA